MFTGKKDKAFLITGFNNYYLRGSALPKLEHSISIPA